MTTQATRQTPVAVTRLSQGLGDIAPTETIKGYLVDQYGNDREAPELGLPVYLAGETRTGTWLFATDSVFRVEVYFDHWMILTDSGAAYMIYNTRTLQ
jgi:hypothetical protein